MNSKDIRLKHCTREKTTSIDVITKRNEGGVVVDSMI